MSQATTLPHATLAAAEESIDALKHLGYQGLDLVVAYQAIESMVIGTTVFETSSTPHYWKRRNTRHRTISYDAFRETTQAPEAVQVIAMEVFAWEFASLLDALERNAPANAQ